MIRLAAVVLVVTTMAAAACESVSHRGRAFTVCTADLARQRADLYLADALGRPLGDFEALEAASPAPVRFAMNAGMYHPDRSPVGLYVEDGREVAPIVTAAGPGNFGMRPNGVLCLMDGRARVIESRTFAANPPACRDATQSGPMLLIDGAVHPRFIEDSPYLNLRNGAGASPDGRTLYLVISDEPVSFHEMATLFRDVLGLFDALYFDGSVSRLYAPGIGRADPGRRTGPMIAVTDR